MKMPPKREIEHIIEVKLGSNIVNIKQYRYPLPQKTEIKRLVQDILKCGIITKRRPYVAPVVLVRKKRWIVWTMNRLSSVKQDNDEEQIYNYFYR